MARADPAEEARGHTEARIPADDASAHSAADPLLRSGPGVTLLRGGATGGGVRIRLRGVSSITLPDQPSLYLDGVRIDDGAGLGGSALGSVIDLLDQILAGEVRRIRILRGPAAASAYPNAASGVILVETVRRREPSPRP